MSEEAEKRKELAHAVQQLQKKGARSSDGRSWAEWIEVNSDLKSHKGNPTLDPKKHCVRTLESFLAALPEEYQGSVRHRLKRVQQGRHALEALKSRVDRIPEKHKQKQKLSRLIALIEHTRAHSSYNGTYGSLPSEDAGWVSLKMSSGANKEEDAIVPAENLLISIDCEMVATADDHSALARISVVDGHCNTLLDRLVLPDADPIDLRTDITGIKAEDLEGLQYRREDAQRDVLKLIKPGMVLVGHTLDKDMSALRLDVPLVVDIGLLYALEGHPTRKPSLVYLMEAVLGQDKFRGSDGQHDSAHDASGAMQLVVHRLSYPEKDAAVVVLPPPPLPEISADNARVLLAHRVPDVAGAFMALVALVSPAAGGLGAKALVSIERQPAKDGLFAAKLIFAKPEEAERIFLALDASSTSMDSHRRPQKFVVMVLPGGEKAKIYVRTMASTLGAAALSSSATSGDAGETRPARPWPGWQDALDEELKVGGGAVPWKRLRTALVARCREGGADDGEGEEMLGYRALACIPGEYLCRTDPLVRRPRDVS